MQTKTHNQINIHEPTVLLDLNHPADFHFFREFMMEAPGKDISLYITAKQRKYLPELLDSQTLPYLLKGKRAHTLFGKWIGLIREIIQLYLLGRKVQPEAFISFASPYAAVAGKLLGKPVISFDDTECNPLLHRIYPPLSDLILTPSCFQKSFGPKHLRFKGFKESVYLKNLIWDKSDQELELPGVGKDEPFIIVRFVDFHSTHEIGQKGLSPAEKHEVVTQLSRHGKVMISSEETLPESLKGYEENVPVDKMHQLLQRATLYFGESTTMAAEAVILGTPAILLEDKGRGYTVELEKRTGRLSRFGTNQLNEALEIADDLLNSRITYFKTSAGYSKRLIEGTTNIHELLMWLMKDPSRHIEMLKKSPEIMNQFTEMRKE